MNLEKLDKNHQIYQENYRTTREFKKGKNHENSLSKLTINNSRTPENNNSNNNCFIIFSKSNIKNLKKEIQRYDSKNVTIENETLNVSNIEERKKYLCKNSEERYINNNTHFNLKSHRYTIDNDFNNDCLSSSPYAKTNNNNNSNIKNDFSKNKVMISSPRNIRKIDETKDSDIYINKKLSKFISNLGESKTNLEKGNLRINLEIIFLNI